MKKIIILLFLGLTAALFAMSDHQKALMPALETVTLNCYKECKGQNEQAVCDQAIDEMEEHTRKIFADAAKAKVDSKHESYGKLQALMEPVCPVEKKRFEGAFPK